jgi:UTP--glucose-1-phosphate uridylyltransferase
MIRQAVIPAAGFGTRFLPATKAVPKEMAVILDRPALQWIVEEALAAGVDEVIIVTSPDKPVLRRHFQADPEGLARLRGHPGRAEALAAMERLEAISTHVRFVDQLEQRGLGHAILCAAERLDPDRPFLVLLGDALVRGARPCAAALAAVSRECGGRSVVGLERVPREKVGRYGIVSGTAVRGDDRLFKLDRLVEKPRQEEAPSDLAVAGRYVLTPAVLGLLKSTRPGVGGEIQITDAIQALLAIEPVYGWRYEGIRHDIGNPLDYLAAALAYAADDPRYASRLCLQGNAR